MNSGEHHYLRINHKNTLDIPNRIEKSKLILSLFTTIASVQEDQIGNELNKYFDYLIPNNYSDLYNINLSLTEEYYAKYHLNANKLYESVHNVLQSDYNTTFVFNEDNTEDIMSILASSFRTLSKYQITTNSEMLKRIEFAVANNYDAIRLFIDNKAFTSLESCSMRSISFISASSNFKEENYQKALVRSTGDSSKTNFNTKDSNNTQFIQMSSIFTYPKRNRKQRFKDILPIEMIILLNKFQSVKTFAFYTEGVKDKQLREILLILLNAKWLFPNLLEIEYDLTNQQMQKDIESIFNRKMSHFNKKTTMYTSEENKQFTWLPNKEIEDDYNNNNFNESFSPKKATRPRNNLKGNNKKKEYSYKNYVLDKSSQVEIIIIYSYFISNLQKLQSLSLTFQDSFSMEIEEILRSKKIFFVDFHFLTFCFQLKSLHELRLIFNSLDIYNFQGLLGMINSNPKLFKLRLSFFNSDENYSPVALYKLCRRLKLNTSDIFNDKILSFSDDNFENGEVDHLMVNKLLTCFEENLEKLFHVLFNYLNIQELILFIALPKIISNNDLYIMVLLKFVIDLLLFLSNEQHCFKVFKLISPLLWFNYRKYPFIEGFIEEVNIEDNKTPLRDFTIQLGFDNVTNVSRMISTRLEILFIGDFDMETFNCFIKYYSSKNFIENSQLTTLTISLNNKIVYYDNVKTEFHQYFTNKPKGLIEQNLISYIRLNTNDEAKEVIRLLFESNKVLSNNIELYEGKEVFLDQLLKKYLNETNMIMVAFAKKNKKSLLKENIINRIKDFLFINKRNPFKIREP